jgi:curved DNA-binding protein CbpA
MDIFRGMAFHYTVCEESGKMGVCKCGKTVRGSGTQCRRCASLQELGLNASASADSIKSAYRVQVKAWHPDRHGETKAQQLAAEEKTKRLNIAYKFLTAPSKRGGVQPPPRSPATPEHLRHHASSTRSDSTNTEATRSNKSRSGTVYTQEQPLKASETSVVQVRPLGKAVSTYPQPDFKKWHAKFNVLLHSCPN